MREREAGGSGFWRSLGFALVAALSSIFWFLVTAPVLGSAKATGILCLLSAVAYLMWIAPSRSRGLTVGLLGGLFALGMALFAAMPSGGVLGAALLVSVVRSGFFFAGKPARALVVEGVLVGGGLLFARLLVGTSPLGLALAVWGFFLVQSLFFLIGGMGARRQEGPCLDPFDEARRQALAVMEDGL